MRVSIIIPTHNRPDFINDCVRSAEVALQTYGEIIVVDDGSSPPTKLHPKTNEYVKIFRIPFAKGAGAARNFGVSKASGELLFFLDDDDEIHPDYIEHILKLRTNGNPAQFGFANYIIRGKSGIKGKVRESRLLCNVNLKKKVAGLGMGFWIERQLFQDIGGLNTEMRLDEDTDLCARLAARGISPWADSMPATKIRRDNVKRLTNSTDQKEICDAHYITLERNIDSFRPWSPDHFFLAHRSVKYAALFRETEIAKKSILRCKNLFFRLILWVTYLKYTRRRMSS